MGVPKFAAWLTKKYPSMVMDRCPADVHGLYIDLNGLIHPCCHDEHDATVALRTELEKLRSVCLAIETLVVTVRPQHVLYIAIDGVAPRAKMNQQRARRYMSAGTPLTNTEKPAHGGGGGNEISAGVVAAIEKEFTAAERTGAEQDLEDVNQALLGDVLYGGSGAAAAADTTSAFAPENVARQQGKKNITPLPEGATSTAPASPVDVDVAPERFDSNCISPGTAFMDKVAAAVRDFVKRKLAPPAESEAEEEEGATEVHNAGKTGDDPLTSPSKPSKREATNAATAAAAAPPSPWSNLTVVFSDSNTAGEGEHKFLDFLRTQSAFPGFNGGGSHVIAGLDADLIFLSLSLHIPRIVILRDHERSSYAKALLSVAAGGTLAATKKAKPAAAVPRSNSTSSIGSAAVVASMTPTATEVENPSPTPQPSEAATTVTAASRQEEEQSMGSQPLLANKGEKKTNKTEKMSGGAEGKESEGGEGELEDDEDSYSFESESDGLDSSAAASPTSVLETPPHIATVVADVNATYEYYDMDVVGSSIVSEVYQLCLEKGFEVVGNPLENNANCIASNGFNYHHSGSAAPPAKKDAKAKTGSSAASSPTPASPSLPAFHPCTSTSNAKIVDDFIVLGMLLGNDFLPHSPSVYCGESAMDTLMDVYVSAVLPHGYLTGGLYEIQLLQLERLLRAYAAVEAVRFRQFAIQSGAMTPQEAATAKLYSAADRRCWRDPYIRTTSLKDEAGVQKACRAYVEGLRFVWRYYSSISLQVSWSWYYPFHHAPFALDVADFLRAQGPNVQATLAAPKLERQPPPPFCQLLCILPPTSRALVPAVLRPSMVHPPSDLAETFPKTWTVDFTGAYGKDHLAAVLLPFANLPVLQKLVEAESSAYSAEETARNTLRATHLVIESAAVAAARATATEDASPSAGEGGKEKPKRGAAAAAAAKARGFSIQGSGLQPLPDADVPAELRDCPSLVCSALADVVPPLSRPRTYSHTVPIPNMTVLPDGSRVPALRRPQSRYGGGNRRRRNNNFTAGGRREEKFAGKDGAGAASGAAGAAAASPANAHATKPSMLFGEFALCLLLFALATAGVMLWHSTTFVPRCQLLLQLSAVALTAVGVIFALGLAVANKGRTGGSGMHRHTIFTAFADWQCARCLSLNFSRNRRCFMCRAPYDPQRCVALFSGRNAPEPPLMDPNHAAYGASYGIISL